MKIIKQKKIEGCLEGTNVKDFLFDEKIDYDFIEYLGQMGKLIYNDKIGKPFFRVIVRGKFTLKGSQGNKTIRMLLPEKGDKELVEQMMNFVNNYEDDLRG